VRSDVVVISQLPPPFHGSTVMTQVFLETINGLGFSAHLVDRRFSQTVGAVGKFSLKKVFSSIGLGIRLIWAVGRYRPGSVVFFMTNRTASFIVDFALSEILRIMRVRVVGYIHTQGYEALASRGRLWRFMVGRLLGSASEIVCLSPALEEDVIGFAKSARVISIANTPLEHPHGRKPKSADSREVLFLSNLIPEKGIFDFLEIAADFHRRGDTAVFVAAGAPTSTTQLDELEQIATDNVKLLGPADSELKWHLLESADVLVFPSQYEFEAQPLVIVEAMAAGLPVLAYQIGGIGDLVETGVSGYAVGAGDRDGLTTRLREYLESDRLRMSMQLAARKRFDTNYSRHVYERTWNELLLNA
jgi:glycosyltransferase involved in cell wall biosynthesis